jgi:RNA ligase
MTKLTDLFGDEGCGCTEGYALEAMIAAGYVRTQRHPSMPLTIYNYTPKTQFEKFWNRVTKTCRGLIVHDDGTVVARPFPKFFNWGEVSVPEFNRDALVTVTDKADGSLGILYRESSDSWAVATRGSFTSEQALEATRMLHELYDDWEPPARLGPVTVLFEIIYPGNRIVLNYGDARELRLIDALWIDRGWPIASDPTVVTQTLGWPGPVVGHLGTTAFKIAMSDLVRDRPNAEGVVLRFLDTDDRYKIKQDDYVALHRTLTGTSARTIWSYLVVNACKDLIAEPQQWQRVGLDPRRAEQILAVGRDWQDRMLANVPDEFYRWVADTIEKIQLSVLKLRAQLSAQLADAKREVSAAGGPPGQVRARLFQAVKRRSPEHHGAMMALFDGKDQTLYCWRKAYPGVEVPFVTVSEDAA